jgi:hypothetical protein
MSVWMVERKELGYRPIVDSGHGEWLLDSCEGFGLKADAEEQVRRLSADADEYTQYRAAEYVRKEGGE